MKEQYLNPELNVVCFAPIQHLANNPFDTSLALDLGDLSGGLKPGVSGIEEGDFGIDVS